MKIAISVKARKRDAAFSSRFGRAAAFVVVDTATGQQEVIANPAAQASGGAGIQAAELLAGQGVEAVISGAFGPKARDVLRASNIQTYRAASGTVDELVAKLVEGDLDTAEDF